MPRRIQRKREKGWRMPEGAVYVGRPTRWGNPLTELMMRRWKPEIQDHRAFAATYFRETVGNGVIGGGLGERHVWKSRPGDWWIDWSYPDWSTIRAELRGRDLACWCPLDQPCHADVLLEIANE
ncbi:DUF4326 domain-containing protein [Aeromicrobium piscarium]|uniref:DUF4326 domain-containing protein n=1 Tax=Aeromicrobium piscarium TaxID=2590901 RepID=A0A554SP18_9ACTN|nr:DUF4326 domain-containing protein [Aeromicrobium piscarium]TSD68096.1 DUF4326 domain-containing protein [Aeromicrobium piscarium]